MARSVHFFTKQLERYSNSSKNLSFIACTMKVLEQYVFESPLAPGGVTASLPTPPQDAALVEVSAGASVVAENPVEGAADFQAQRQAAAST